MNKCYCAFILICGSDLFSEGNTALRAEFLFQIIYAIYFKSHSMYIYIYIYLKGTSS